MITQILGRGCSSAVDHEFKPRRMSLMEAALLVFLIKMDADLISLRQNRLNRQKTKNILTICVFFDTSNISDGGI